MLTRDLAVASFQGQRLVPDRLTRRTHSRYARYAEQMLAIYRYGIGKTRRELHQAVHAVFSSEPDCPIRRIDAFCKLLDEAGEFVRDERGKAAALRREVFRLAAPHHPLVSRADSLFEHEESAAKQTIATQLGRSWSEIDAALFADIQEFHPLRSFAGYPSGVALLSRYNVAQTQVALFDAVEIVIRATDDFKTILRHAKLARLMHTIRQLPSNAYEIRCDGPASVLHETRRYGVAMARFLPALLACRGWTLHAVLKNRRFSWKSFLDLSPADGLASHLDSPDPFDSSVEETFAQKWGPDPREGWTLHREATVLHCGQKVFIPDFVFQHVDGRVRLLEIIGFWTPEYLEAKVETLKVFENHAILLAVAASVAAQLPALPPGTILYKSGLKVGDVLERLA